MCDLKVSHSIKTKKKKIINIVIVRQTIIRNNDHYSFLYLASHNVGKKCLKLQWQTK